MLCCETSNISVDVKVKIAVGNEKFGDGSYQKKQHNGNSDGHSFKNRLYGNDQRKINGICSIKYVFNLCSKLQNNFVQNPFSMDYLEKKMLGNYLEEIRK